MLNRTMLLFPVILVALLTAASGAVAGLPTIAPAVTKLTVAPASFKALPAGSPVVLSGGAKVSFTIADGTNVDFVVKAEKSGKRAGGTCVAGKPKKTSGACTRTVAVPGAFKLVGITGPNEFRFSGRMDDKALVPGRYRIVAKPVGKAARSSFARFTIIK